ncbi:MAG: hypothetical protein Q9211_002529 [Gyalolechia sp. 1 TL-2023]
MVDDLLLHPLTYRPAEATGREPTDAERAVAGARVRELQEDFDEIWRPRRERAAMRAEIERNEKISKGGLICEPTPPKNRGRPRGKKSGAKMVFEDSDPEIDALGYRPGQREVEDRKFERAAQSLAPVKGRTQVPELSEEDTEPPPPTKKRRTVYAPTLPPANQLGRAATNPHLPPTEEYYNPYHTPHDNPYTSSITHNPTQPTWQHGPALSRSLFEQRLEEMNRGNAVSQGVYPPGFDHKPTGYTSAYENPATRPMHGDGHSQGQHFHPHDDRYTQAVMTHHQGPYGGHYIEEDARPGAVDKRWQ